jgi:CMP-N-acetylneuraminic acid synthetase
MSEDKSFLGILPARGGSKGVVNKNIRLLNGLPLISWAAKALASSSLVSKKICSTDHAVIAEIAKKSGLEVPWIRPKNLAQDETLVIDVISHALNTVKKSDGSIYSHVVLVQATSPTVTSEDIDSCIRLALKSDVDTVLTGFEAGQKHPSTMYKISDRGLVDWITNEEERMTRRQDLSAVYIRTGLVYVIKSETILREKTIYGKKIASYSVPESRAITIDTHEDFNRAEQFFNEKRNE